MPPTRAFVQSLRWAVRTVCPVRSKLVSGRAMRGRDLDLFTAKAEIELPPRRCETERTLPRSAFLGVRPCPPCRRLSDPGGTGRASTRLGEDQSVPSALVHSEPASAMSTDISVVSIYVRPARASLCTPSHASGSWPLRISSQRLGSGCAWPDPVDDLVQALFHLVKRRNRRFPSCHRMQRANPFAQDPSPGARQASPYRWLRNRKTRSMDGIVILCSPQSTRNEETTMFSLTSESVKPDRVVHPGEHFHLPCLTGLDQDTGRRPRRCGIV